MPEMAVQWGQGTIQASAHGLYLPVHLPAAHSREWSNFQTSPAIQDPWAMRWLSSLSLGWDPSLLSS